MSYLEGTVFPPWLVSERIPRGELEDELPELAEAIQTNLMPLTANTLAI